MERSPRALGRDGEGERGMSRRRPNHHPVLGDALPPELVAGRPPPHPFGSFGGGAPSRCAEARFSTSDNPSTFPVGRSQLEVNKCRT